ncbi:MAG: ATP-dependent DNA helicase RecQ [Bacteroidetes bacterium]|nr:ATP-dependent DNA helicase RecQ [Bacteroidota bacterium]
MQYPHIPAQIEEDPSRLYERALVFLRRYWGHADFRPGQWRTIQAVLEGRDVLGVLPTGGGKSLCYQVPALISGRLTLVVSPLIALMEDQIRGLVARGIPAANLAGNLSRPKMAEILESARYGVYRVLYVSPERLNTEEFRSRAGKLPVGLLAVDEAHCVSEWGHDFRPEYRTIPRIYEAVKRPPVIALTATAAPRTRTDIIRCLLLKNPLVIQEGIDRPNLIFSVFRTHAKRKMVREILEAVPGSAVVYASTRLDVEVWGDTLIRDGYLTETYHGGMNSEARTLAQYRWQTGRTRVMVATNAFGMGIDKPDVRSVTHVGLPLSIEAYYQEAGRAGRDGERAYATLLFGPEDARLRTQMQTSTHPLPVGIRGATGWFGRSGRDVRTSFRLRRRALRRLKEMTTYARAATCRRRMLLAHFGEYSIRDCGRCDVCMGRHRRFVPDRATEKVYQAVAGAVLSGASPYEGMRGSGIPRYRQEQIIWWMIRNGYLEAGSPVAP